MNQSDKSWLIKSSTRILGPFDQEGIRQLILNKQISVIDEVRTPKGRWTYIRENNIFREAVEMVRAELSRMSEETMTQSIAHQTKTDAITEAGLKTKSDIKFQDDLTPPPILNTAPTNSSSAPIKDIVSVKENAVKKSFSTSTYGMAESNDFTRSLEKKSKNLRWAVLVLAGIVVAGAVYLNTTKSKPTGKTFNDYISAAYKYKSLGLYELALKNYKEGAQLKEPNIEVKAAMAPLMIQVDAQTIAGRRILEQYMLNRDLSRGEISEMNLSLALSYMMERDLGNAEKNLEKIKATDPQNKFLKLNLAVLQLERNNFQGAYVQFDELLNKFVDFREALVGKAIAALRMAESGGNPELLASVRNEVNSVLNKSPYLKHEMLTVLAAIESELDNVNGVQKVINEFLSGLPVQSSKFSKPMLAYQGYFSWEKLERFCTNVFRKPPQYSEKKAFFAQCLKRANRDSESARAMNEAYKESPKSPYVLLAMANEFIEQNRSPEAFSVLKQPELTNMVGKDLLMGNVCIQSKDVNCAKGAFTSAYRKSGKDINSVYGLAWVAIKGENRSLAYQYISEGLQIAPTYMPLIELRDLMENQ